MAVKPEQLNGYKFRSRGYKRYIKRVTAKYRRRLLKKCHDIIATGIRVTSGWAD